MCVLRIVENHGHNGDEETTRVFSDYDDAWKYVLEFYFNNDESEMLSAEDEPDNWYCEEADAWITIE